MFKKYYKEANDDIKTNRELIDKIFEAAEKPVKKKPIARFYKFGMAAAAVLVIALSVSFLPDMLKNGDSKSSGETSHLAQSGTVNPSNGVSVANDESAQNLPTESGETNVEVQTEIKQEPESVTEPKDSEGHTVESIKPEEGDNNSSESSAENPVLALETGEGQEFIIPDGRIADPPQENQENTEYFVAVDEWQEVSQEESEVVAEFLRDKYGEKDEKTGFDYGFYIEGKAEVDGETVYFVRMSWLVDNNHWSLLQNFVINESFTEMYYSVFLDRSQVYWTTTQNILE